MILPLANILQPIIDVAEAFLKLLHDDVGFGWGVAIIILTFATRIVILPLSITQIRSMRALQAYQPQIKALQERYKDDKQRMQRELMAFYQENKINPLASCLPLLLQLPVFLALFSLLRSGSFKDDLHASGDPGFIGIPDLAEKATDTVLVVLLVLYFVTFVASIAITATQAEGTQRVIMFALPVIFTPLIVGFPAGLIVYWIATNVWTIGQQMVIKQFFPPPPKPTMEEIQAARPPPPPPRKRKRRR